MSLWWRGISLGIWHADDDCTLHLLLTTLLMYIYTAIPVLYFYYANAGEHEEAGHYNCLVQP